MCSRRLAVVVGLVLSLDGMIAWSQPLAPKAAPPATANPIRQNPSPANPSVANPSPPAATASQAQPEPGYLGVMADHANEQGRGIRILAVMPNSPAQAAGLEPRDLVTSINGQAVATVNDMAALMRPLLPNDEASFVVRRGNEVRRVDVRLGVRPPLSSIAPQPLGSTVAPGPSVVPGPSIVRSPVAEPSETLPNPAPPIAAAPTAPPSGGGLLGVRAVPVTAEMQRSLNLPEARGALIIDVRDGSAAQRAGLPLEAVIVAIDDRRVDSPQQLADMVGDRGPGAEVKLSYFRLGQLTEKKVTLGGAAPPVEVPTPMPVPPRILGAPSTTPTMPLVPSIPPPVAPPASASEETEALRRRVRELETRLAEMEAKLKANGAPQKP